MLNTDLNSLYYYVCDGIAQSWRANTAHAQDVEREGISNKIRILENSWNHLFYNLNRCWFFPNCSSLNLTFHACWWNLTIVGLTSPLQSQRCKLITSYSICICSHIYIFVVVERESAEDYVGIILGMVNWFSPKFFYRKKNNKKSLNSESVICFWSC